MSTVQNDWIDLLRQQGAEFEQGRVTGFGTGGATLQEFGCSNLLVPLTHLALLCASGPDTTEFLQGQTGNDVRQVDAGHHQLSSYSTAKGRMLALFSLFMRGGDYYLQLPQELLPAVQKRLTMFVLRSQVRIEAAEELVSLGLFGPQAEALVTQLLGGSPQESGASLEVDGITVLRRPGELPAFTLVAERERATALWQALLPQCRPATAGMWDLLEIRAGIPHILNTTVEAFVPQMVNMQLIDGVSFKKGCYPGQEVVARMQYLGKLKRRMYRARVAVETPPEAGTPLHAPGSESGQGAGKVVRAAAAPEGGCELLVVAEISSAEGGTLRLQDEGGAELTLLELPYPFTTQDS